jgi:hypothetical protein
MVSKAGGISGAGRQLSSGLGEMAPVFLAGGALAALNARRLKLQAQRAANWSVCSGVVTESTVDSKKRVGVSTSVGRGTPVKQRYFRQNVTYRYTVGGTQYDGHRLRFGDGTWELDRGVIERLIAPYPGGAAIEVRYDPHAPRESVLDLTPMPVARHAIVFAVVCFALSAYGWLQW